MLNAVESAKCKNFIRTMKRTLAVWPKFINENVRWVFVLLTARRGPDLAAYAMRMNDVESS